jgi:DNA-directed RNA polymerase specialized sigma24 family protein
MQQIVYARHEHGGHRVERGAQGITVHWPSGPTVYPSVRQTLAALTHGVPCPTKDMRTPSLTFDRYFRLNRPPVSSIDAIDFFNTIILPIPAAVPAETLSNDSEFLVVHLAPPLPITPYEKPRGVRGIDLAARGHEVRKLFYAGFMGRVMRYGYDPEDVLQEIYQGILVRNQGKCPFDPKKSSFGHYVHMVSECIISNYHRKHNRRAQLEQFGVSDRDGEEQDVAKTDLAVSEPDQEERISHELAMRSLESSLLDAASSITTSTDMTLVQKCLPLLTKGMTRSEVANQLFREGVNRTRALQAVDFIRSVASGWRSEIR